MPDTSSPQADELRSKAKLVRIGCAINVLLFAALAVVMVVFLIATARTLDFTPATSEGAADEAAIRRVINDQAAAWNKGDLDGFMAGYWKDEKLTFTSGSFIWLWLTSAPVMLSPVSETFFSTNQVR